MATRVVLVDDFAAIRSMLRMRLEGNGCIVVGEAEDGHDAVRQVETLKPDLVIMDLEMPRMHGDEATREVLKRVPDVKVVGYTSSAQNASQRMLAAGAAAAFAKQDFAGLLEFVGSLA